MTPGSFVLVNCVNPKEQFWGILHSLDPAGITFRGLDVRIFDDWMREVARDPEASDLGVVTIFIPMFRVERVFQDERVGQVPAYCERFEETVGRPASAILGGTGAAT